MQHWPPHSRHTPKYFKLLKQLGILARVHRMCLMCSINSNNSKSAFTSTQIKQSDWKRTGASDDTAQYRSQRCHLVLPMSPKFQNKQGYTIHLKIFLANHFQHMTSVLVNWIMYRYSTLINASWGKVIVKYNQNLKCVIFTSELHSNISQYRKKN